LIDQRPPLPPSLLAFIERSLRNLLQLDPEAQQRVARMAGKVLAVELKGLEQTLYLFPERDGLRLTGQHEGNVHVRVRGTPLALLAMAANREHRNATFSGDVEIIGDLALGRHLQALLADLDVDWEELLSRYVGDIAAHQLGNFGRAFARWAGRTRRVLEQNTVEYLRIEAELVPDTADVQDFMNAVDGLRSDVDRLEARLRRLQQQVTGPR
jgi:ubiquinone biosynthesis protein UbiJ